ncbi:MAG: hypothetical protein OEV70_14700 [Nitrospirota bacterium]|nr:hypothetical protein [Nitrospirota bacterium]
MKWSTSKGMIAVVFVLGLSTSSVYSGTAGENEWVGGKTQREEVSRFPGSFTSGMRNIPPALSEGHEMKIDANRCLQVDVKKGMGLEQELPQQGEHAVIQAQMSGSIYLAAMDSLDGPPPCEKDNVCNLAVCPNDPDCPAGLPEAATNDPPSHEPEHDEGGMGTSVWLTTGPDGYEGGHSCDFDKGTCNIKVTWSVQPDRYDKWKICWKDWGDTFTNACDVNQKVRKFENNFYVIPDLKEGQHYRIRLEGRKDSNDKWKCLAKARLRNVHLNGTNIGDTVPCFVP